MAKEGKMMKNMVTKIGCDRWPKIITISKLFFLNKNAKLYFLFQLSMLTVAKECCMFGP